MRGHARGSSPRARGTVFDMQITANSGRFIPAGAGNSVAWYLYLPPATVHPRGRGEQTGVLSFGNHDNGSSPRARGTGLITALGGSKERFIPAGAGNSRPHLRQRRFCTVHPRGRGEQLYSGSAGRQTARFIPAGAGNSPMAMDKAQSLPVHPRGRGEQPMKI